MNKPSRVLVLITSLIFPGLNVYPKSTPPAGKVDKLTRKDRDALIEEGERLVRFVEASAKSFEVRFTSV